MMENLENLQKSELNVSAFLTEARTRGHAMTIAGGAVDRRDLLDALIDDVGHGALVDIVSWTIGLKDCEWLELQVQSGRIGQLRLIADVSTRAKSPERYEPLARIGQVIDIGDVHAKASIVRSANGERGWVEVTSANLNRNRRYESHALSNAPDVVASMLAEFEAVKTDEFAPTGSHYSEDEDEDLVGQILACDEDVVDSLLRQLGG